MNPVIADSELYNRLRSVLGRGWIRIPDRPGYGGTGAPGKVLEEELGINGGNFDTPDAGRWEIKFHSGSAPLTLFHLEAKPQGHMHDMVRAFGWPDDMGRTSFRHTIWGESPIGLYIVNENNRITVRHPTITVPEWPYWTHDGLMTSFASKLRRLIAVKGQQESIDGFKHVRYDAAHLYWDPQLASLIDAVTKGMIAIDFDARTNNGSGIRNHGTKFRVAVENLHKLYAQQKSFQHEPQGD